MHHCWPVLKSMARRPIRLCLLVFSHLSAHVCLCRQPEQPTTEEQQPAEQSQPAEKAQAEDQASPEDMER